MNSSRAAWAIPLSGCWGAGEPEAAGFRERLDALEMDMERPEGGMDAFADELRGNLEENWSAVNEKADARDQGKDHDGRVDGEGTGRFEYITTPVVAGLQQTRGSRSDCRIRKL